VGQRDVSILKKPKNKKSFCCRGGKGEEKIKRELNPRDLQKVIQGRGKTGNKKLPKTAARQERDDGGGAATWRGKVRPRKSPRTHLKGP